MGLFRKKKDAGRHLTPAEEAQFWKELKRTLATTSKQLVWILTVNGILWIWCSYILAFMGKDQIAESLSGDVCKVVIGELIVYLITSTVESVFKYNTFSFSKPNNLNDQKGGNSNVTQEQSVDPSAIGPEADGSGDPGEL